MAVAQTFKISLGGETYNLNLVWNNIGKVWMLDISDASNNPIVQAIPVVPGVGFLRQFRYLGFTGDLFTQTSGDADAIPTYTSLGSTSQLYYTTDESIV